MRPTQVYVEVVDNDFEKAVRTYKRRSKGLVRQAKARAAFDGKKRKKKKKQEKSRSRVARKGEADSTFLAHSLSYLTDREPVEKRDSSFFRQRRAFGEDGKIIQGKKGVLVVIIKRKGPKIIVIKDRDKLDKDDKPLFGFVYGGVEGEETPIDACIREAQEEAFFKQSVSLRIDEECLIDTFYKGRDYSYTAYYAFVDESAKVFPGKEQISAHEWSPEQVDEAILMGEFVGPHASLWRILRHRFAHVLRSAA